MKNPLGMTVVLSHPESPRISEQIALFSEIGFDSFFLGCNATDEFFRIPEWSKIADGCNIKFEAVHAPVGAIGILWEGGRAAEECMLKMYNIIDLCAEASVGKIVVHVSPKKQIDENKTVFCKLDILERYAEKAGVSICYENSSDPIKFKETLGRVSLPHGVCYDIGHWNYLTPEYEMLEIYGANLLYTHIHDNFGVKDDHILPFDGAIDFEEYAKRIARMGYTGTLNLECACRYSAEYRKMSFRDFTVLAYERVLKLRDLVEKERALILK